MLVNNWYTSRKLIDTYSQKEFHLILIGGLQANPLRPGPVLKLLNSILTNIQKTAIDSFTASVHDYKVHLGNTKNAKVLLS